jgi:hypothetical protein
MIIWTDLVKGRSIPVVLKLALPDVEEYNILKQYSNRPRFRIHAKRVEKIHEVSERRGLQ